tara:strand:+ start:62 stop:439 length:378 start_codon:yes stop_codon:yes gene_type:complete
MPVITWRDLELGEKILIGDRCFGEDRKWFEMKKEHLTFRNIVCQATHPIQRKVEDNQLKADAISELVNTMIGAFESGFVDRSALTLQELHRVAQNHIKDNYDIEVKGIVEEWGRDLAEKCGLAKR